MADNPDWWRFTGIAGLKPFMPDRIIQWAKEKGYGWTKWYEPVCKTCHPDKDDLVRTVVDVETRLGDLVITCTNGSYTISVGGVVRHPNIDADGALRAMGHYVHGAEYSLMKIAKQASTEI